MFKTSKVLLILLICCQMQQGASAPILQIIPRIRATELPVQPETIEEIKNTEAERANCSCPTKMSEEIAEDTIEKPALYSVEFPNITIGDLTEPETNRSTTEPSNVVNCPAQNTTEHRVSECLFSLLHSTKRTLKRAMPVEPEHQAYAAGLGATLLALGLALIMGRSVRCTVRTNDQAYELDSEPANRDTTVGIRLRALPQDRPTRETLRQRSEMMAELEATLAARLANNINLQSS